MRNFSCQLACMSIFKYLCYFHCFFYKILVSSLTYKNIANMTDSLGEKFFILLTEDAKY